MSDSWACRVSLGAWVPNQLGALGWCQSVSLSLFQHSASTSLHMKWSPLQWLMQNYRGSKLNKWHYTAGSVSSRVRHERASVWFFCHSSNKTRSIKHICPACLSPPPPIPQPVGTGCGKAFTKNSKDFWAVTAKSGAVLSCTPLRNLKKKKHTEKPNICRDPKRVTKSFKHMTNWRLNDSFKTITLACGSEEIEAGGGGSCDSWNEKHSNLCCDETWREK